MAGVKQGRVDDRYSEKFTGKGGKDAWDEAQIKLRQSDKTDMPSQETDSNPFPTQTPESAPKTGAKANDTAGKKPQQPSDRGIYNQLDPETGKFNGGY